MSKLPSKKDWANVRQRADTYYSLRRAYYQFLRDKAKLVAQERGENEL